MILLNILYKINIKLNNVFCMSDGFGRKIWYPSSKLEVSVMSRLLTFIETDGVPSTSLREK